MHLTITRKNIQRHIGETCQRIVKDKARNCSTPTPPSPAQELIELLNEDLAREYQAIIAYVNYSQVLKGAQYMNIAGELAVHATEELAHAIAHRQSHRLSRRHAHRHPQARQDLREGTKTCSASISKTRKRPSRNYRRRVKQCDELNEFAIGESIREILMQEQDHLIALATALGIDPPNPGIAD